MLLLDEVRKGIAKNCRLETNLRRRNMKSSEEFNKIWAKIVAKAWSDPAFKARLLKDPAAVLDEHGYKVTSGMEFHIDENTESSIHLTLPRKPQGELSKVELERLAVGACYIIT